MDTVRDVDRPTVGSGKGGSVIEQGSKYAHKGTPVIALESGSLQSMVKVLPVPRDTPYESAYYCWATELVPAPMKYLGGQTAWDNTQMAGA